MRSEFATLKSKMQLETDRAKKVEDLLGRISAAFGSEHLKIPTSFTAAEDFDKAELMMTSELRRLRMAVADKGKRAAQIDQTASLSGDVPYKSSLPSFFDIFEGDDSFGGSPPACSYRRGFADGGPLVEGAALLHARCRIRELEIEVAPFFILPPNQIKKCRVDKQIEEVGRKKAEAERQVASFLKFDTPAPHRVTAVSGPIHTTQSSTQTQEPISWRIGTHRSHAGKLLLHTCSDTCFLGQIPRHTNRQT